MANLKDLLQSADWKAEKHVPVIEVADKISKGQLINLEVSVGKQIPHPNTTEHHISYIEVYFLPQAEKFPYQIGRFEFNSHGASAGGPNTSTIFTEPKVTLVFKSEKSGTIIASSYCNIHGIWTDGKEIKIE